jgi:hypothetical protein
MNQEAEEKEAPERNLVRKEKWQSEICIFDSSGKFVRMESDGVFELEIDDSTKKVKGTHSHPTAHDVTGDIQPTTPPGIFLISADGARIHTGGLKEINGKQYYIGMKLLPNRMKLREQEEGVWVGTKT